MKFEVYTQDGFNYKGIKEFKNLEELMEFVKLHKIYNGISISGNEIFIMNMGKEDLF